MEIIGWVTYLSFHNCISLLFVVVVVVVVVVIINYYNDAHRNSIMRFC